MEQVRKKLAEILKLKYQIMEIKDEVLHPIEKVAPGVFDIKVEFGSICLIEKHSERPFDIHFKCWFGDDEIRTFIEIIAETMENQDFPVPPRDIQDLLNKFDCNNLERDLIESKASSDEAYDSWVEEERRMMLD